VLGRNIGNDVLDVNRDGTLVMTSATPSRREKWTIVSGEGWTLHRRTVESDHYTAVWTLPDKDGVVEFDPTGSYLVGVRRSPFQGGHSDGLIARTSDGVKTASFDGRFRDRMLGFTPGSREVLISRDGHDLELVAVDGSGIRPAGFLGSERVEAAAFSGDGHRLYTAESDTPASSGRIRIWDCVARRQIGRIACGSRIRLLAISPDQSRVAVVNDGGVVRVCDLNSAEEVVRFTESLVPSLLRFHRDQNHLVLVSRESIRIRSWQDGELIAGLCDRLGDRVMQPPDGIVLPARRYLPSACNLK
jgi:WD40 repeat protein